MTNHSYRSKLRKWYSADDAKKDESLLLRLLEDLNVSEWQDLLSDIFLDSPSAYEVFWLPKGERILPYSIAYLNRLGRSARKSISRTLERLIGLGISTEEDRLTDGGLLVAASILEEPLLSYLLNLVQQEQLREDIRTGVASVLSSHCAAVPVSFWTNIDMERYPALAPMCIAALGPVIPSAALHVLSRLQLDPENPSLEYPLRLTLRSLFKQEDAMQKLSQFWMTSSREVKLLLQSVFEFAEFSPFSEDIYEIMGTPEEESRRVAPWSLSQEYAVQSWLVEFGDASKLKPALEELVGACD
jgi:hypothetical protein